MDDPGDRKNASPGATDNIHNLLMPAGATKVAFIHSTTLESDNPYDFHIKAPNIADEEAVMPFLDYYLVTPDGGLRVHLGDTHGSNEGRDFELVYAGGIKDGNVIEYKVVFSLFDSKINGKKNTNTSLERIDNGDPIHVPRRTKGTGRSIINFVPPHPGSAGPMRPGHYKAEELY